jgi:hypothetical protein
MCYDLFASAVRLQRRQTVGARFGGGRKSATCRVLLMEPRPPRILGSLNSRDCGVARVISSEFTSTLNPGPQSRELKD